MSQMRQGSLAAALAAGDIEGIKKDFQQITATLKLSRRILKEEEARLGREVGYKILYPEKWAGRYLITGCLGCFAKERICIASVGKE